MTKQLNASEMPARNDQYSAPTLVVYGGVVGLTAAGTQPPTENNGTGGAVKQP